MSTYVWDLISANLRVNGDARVENWLLIGNPWTIVAISAIYIAMCILGPRIIASRQPFELKAVLVVYNSAMVLLSLHMVKELLVCALQLKYNFVCDQVEYKTEPAHMRLASVIWLFYVSKLIEFLDTLFFILRKKNSQITFLHVYHHSSMFVIWWIVTKWFAGGLSFFSPLLNSSVHVIMYSYYGLSLFPSLKKYLWWKKYVTSLQIAQFVIIIFLALYNLMTGCEYDYRMQIFLAVYIMTLLVLFLNFYFKSYLKNPKFKPEMAALNSFESMKAGRNADFNLCDDLGNSKEDMNGSSERVRHRL